MPSRLTFGAEFEFLLASLDIDGPADPEPDDPRTIVRIPTQISHVAAKEEALAAEKGMAPIWGLAGFKELEYQRFHVHRTCIRKLFADASIPVLEWEPGSEQYSSIKIVQENGGSPEVDPRLTMWAVDSDSSIRVPDPSPYDWIEIEVVSPVYQAGDPAINAVKIASEILTSNLRISVNDSCGHHVHVGNGSEGFDFPLLKNLIAIIWTYEPELDRLHPPHRQGTMWALSLRKSSTLRSKFKDRRGIGFMTCYAIMKVFETKTFNELQKLVSDSESKGMAYNFRNLLEPYLSETKKTIEFRQHCATLDSRRISAWIQVVLRLVRYAQECDITALTRQLIKDATKEDLDDPERTDIFGLLGMIGCGDEISQFYRERFGDDGREPADPNVLPSFSDSEPLDSKSSDSTWLGASLGWVEASI
jgi:hypothetical protein